MMKSPALFENITLGSFESAALKAATNPNCVIIVIDVFRAFTTAAVALNNGAEKIIMVDDLDQAFELRDQAKGHICLGERRGIKPAGFDYGNSPDEIKQLDFSGKTLIQTTSNGTRGIMAASNAAAIFAGSFVTAAAIAQAIDKSNFRKVALIAMGENDVIKTDEDELCALYIRSLLMGRTPDKQAVATIVKTMSPRTDTISLSAADLDQCLNIDAMPFAISVTLENGYCVASKQYPTQD